MTRSLTAYIYRHVSHLLIDEERAAETLPIQQLKHERNSLATGSIDDNGLCEVRAKYPDLARRNDAVGVAAVMDAAAERVLRDNPDAEILNNCSKCGSLRRTPKAQQSFECGHDWHPGRSVT